MPYCTSCGAKVQGDDRFCRRCGDLQPGRPGSAASSPLSPRGASILCYVPWLGWIAAVYVLASDRFRQAAGVRFHAYQGLYLFVAWLLVHWGVGLWTRMLFDARFPLEKLLELCVLGVWILMLVKTTKGEDYELPIIGEVARRSL